MFFNSTDIDTTYSPPPPPPTSGSESINLASKEIQVFATQTAQWIRKTYLFTLDYFWPGYRKRLTEKEKINLQIAILRKLDNALCETVEQAQVRWDKKIRTLLVENIKNILDHPAVNKEDDFRIDWMNKRLKGALSVKAYEETVEAYKQATNTDLNKNDPRSSRWVHHPKKITLTKKRKLLLQRAIPIKLKNGLSRTIKAAQMRWGKKTEELLHKEIKGLLSEISNDPSLETKKKILQMNWINKELKTSFPPFIYQNLAKIYKRSLARLSQQNKNSQNDTRDSSQTRSKPPKISLTNPIDSASPMSQKKRAEEQQDPPPLAIEEHPLDSNTTAPYETFDACSSGKNLVIVGATGNQTNTTDQNTQRIRFITQNGNRTEILETESEAASGQLPPRQGKNVFNIACDDQGIADIISEDPNQGYFHARTTNQTVSIRQYRIQGYNATTRPVSHTAWSIARLLKNLSVLTPTSANSYYALYTNNSNQFPLGGAQNLYTFPNSPPLTAQQVISLKDGSYFILQDLGQLNKIAIRTFNPSRSLTGTASLDFNPMMTGTIKGLPIGPKTPCPNNGKPILFAVPVDKGGNQETTVLFEYLSNQQKIGSWRELSPRAENLNGKISIANCQDYSDLFIHAWDEQVTKNNETSYHLRWNVFNLTKEIYSLTGDMTYPNCSSQPPLPQAICLSNGKGAVAYLKNGRPYLLSFNFLNNGNSTSVPISIVIKIPIDLGDTPISLSDIITITGDIKTIKVPNLIGYQLFYNDTLINPENRTFSVDELMHLAISKGNASTTGLFTVEACDAQGNCYEETATPGVAKAFVGQNPNLFTIVILSIAIPGICGISTIVVYKNKKCMKKIAPFRARGPAQLDYQVSSQETKNKDNKYHQYPAN